MKIKDKTALCFDDVLMVPQFSEITSRNNVDISTKLGSIPLTLPIVSSNMDTVTEHEMALAMSKRGGAGILHRFASIDNQSFWLRNLRSSQIRPRIISIGLDVNWSMLDFLVSEYDLDAVCVDIAHGHHTKVLSLILELRESMPDINIIAGNVATGEAACQLVEHGANIIKVGVGGGSVCSTRIVSGHGVPTFQSILDVHQALTEKGVRDKVSIIGDGGFRYPSDIVKALAAGADAAMLGSLLAGTDEAAGERIVEDGIAYKTYRGMASFEVQKEKRTDRKPRVEGVSAKVPYKGPVSDTLDNLSAGIRSGFSYSGASNLAELRAKAEFVVVTGNTVKENHPHHPYRL